MSIFKKGLAKKLTSGLLIALLALGAFPMLAFAESTDSTDIDVTKETTETTSLELLLDQQENQLLTIESGLEALTLENTGSESLLNQLAPETGGELSTDASDALFGQESDELSTLEYLYNKDNQSFLTCKGGITDPKNYQGPVWSSNYVNDFGLFAVNETIETLGYGTTFKMTAGGRTEEFIYLPVGYLIYAVDSSGNTVGDIIQRKVVNSSPSKAKWDLNSLIWSFKISAPGEYQVGTVYYIYSTKTGALQVDSKNEPYGDARIKYFKVIKDVSNDSRVTVFAGSGRHDTAAKVATSAYPGSAPGVIIAAGYGSGDQGKFADALAASALSGLLDYPILLTEKTALPTQTRAALASLKPARIVVLGDGNTISAAVRKDLANYSSDIVSIAGKNRVETAIKIYQQGIADKPGGWSKTAIFAFSGKFPDALAISPFAAYSKSPIFLVEGKSLSNNVRDAVTAGGFTDAIIVGSTSAVTQGVENDIASIIGKPVTRLGGTNRYDTAKKIAAYCVDHLGMHYNEAGIATGQNFPDALAGGPLLGKKGAVLLLAHDGDISVLSLLEDNKASISKIYIFGSTGAVGQLVRNVAAVRLGWY